MKRRIIEHLCSTCSNSDIGNFLFHNTCSDISNRQKRIPDTQPFYDKRQQYGSISYLFRHQGKCQRHINPHSRLQSIHLYGRISPQYCLLCCPIGTGYIPYRISLYNNMCYISFQIRNQLFPYRLIHITSNRFSMHCIFSSKFP